MPIFLKNKILFIHIPKNGGTSIEIYMKTLGDKMDLWKHGNFKNFYLFHSEQHCTFKEIVNIKKYNPEYRTFSVIRHPIDRVVSEYNYLINVGRKFEDFNSFLDLFLNKENYRKFDNHNLSNFDYLSNEDGEIPDEIKIFKFFDAEGISNFIGFKNKKIGHHNSMTKMIKEINNEQKERILDFYKDDIHCFDFDINSPILIRNKNLKNL